jgi:hypothetical protein
MTERTKRKTRAAERSGKSMLPGGNRRPGFFRLTERTSHLRTAGSPTTRCEWSGVSHISAAAERLDAVVVFKC